MNEPEEQPLPLYNLETYNWSHNLGRLVTDVAGGLGRAVDRRAKQFGITGPQWVVLVRISSGVRSTAAELCRELNYDSGSMTRMLDRLVDLGLVRRVRSEEDRRLVRLELTEEGQKLSLHLPPIAIDVLNLHTKGFTLEEMNQLMGFLQRLLNNGASE